MIVVAFGTQDAQICREKCRNSTKYGNSYIKIRDRHLIENLRPYTKHKILTVGGWECPSNALQFPLRGLESLTFLLQAFPATLNIGQLL